MCATSWRGEVFHVLFENWKMCPDCFHLWVEFSIQNIALRASRRKKFKMFPCGASICCDFDMISCVFDMLLKCLLKCPSSTTSPSPCPEKFHSFWKTLHLKCLTVFWIRLCFDTCSVTCTVTLCYAKQQIHSEFWHIQYSVFSGIHRYIKSYSTLLMNIHAYWHIKVYSDLYRDIQYAVYSRVPNKTSPRLFFFKNVFYFLPPLIRIPPLIKFYTFWE